ncbi:MAG: DUF1598 domain-containing protein [Planctomycetia bacterium]|nr:DUF1598 domain-containing protein [Planctomycetia bacterium]
MMSNLLARKSFRTVCFLSLGFLAISLATAVWESVTTAPTLSNVAYAQNNNNNNNNSNNNSNNRSGRSGNNNSNNNNDNGSSMSDLEYMGWGYRSMVGGFAIDAEKAFRVAAREEVSELGQTVRSALAAIPSDLDQAVTQRKVSLRRLNDLVARCHADETPIPDAARYLGGLTAIEYVVAVPEENDIYLVGPAEGWTADDAGTIVGKESGKPVLLLEDLLTVLRAWNNTKPEVISCSIDPTQEALARFAAMEPMADPEVKREANEAAMGMMTVSFSGIPESSRMATVLAAADYRMKRLSLGFDAAPIKSLPSYFSMIRAKSSSSFAPRFWIEPAYDTVYHDADGLVWNVAATKAQALTEREYFDSLGNRTVSKKEDVAANRWARAMTERYDDLAEKDTVFAEVKNCMDLALVVALVRFQNLPEKSGCDLASLSDARILPTPDRGAVAQVPGNSLVRTIGTRGDYVSVTGGIEINPWEIVRDNVAVKADLVNPAVAVRFAEDAFWAN